MLKSQFLFFVFFEGAFIVVKNVSHANNTKAFICVQGCWKEEMKMTGVNYLITRMKSCFCWIVYECCVCVGQRTLTILGSGLGRQTNDSVVFVGTKECVTLQWTPTNITCALPVLPPGLYDVFVQVGNNGYPQTRYSWSKKSFHTKWFGNVVCVCGHTIWNGFGLITS